MVNSMILTVTIYAKAKTFAIISYISVTNSKENRVSGTRDVDTLPKSK